MKRRNNLDITVTAALLYIAAVFVMCFGWVMNIIAIAHTADLPLSGMFLLRVAGIFVVPLGCVLGYF